jgi:hypothetical protein
LPRLTHKIPETACKGSFTLQIAKAALHVRQAAGVPVQAAKNRPFEPAHKQKKGRLSGPFLWNLKLSKII